MDHEQNARHQGLRRRVKVGKWIHAAQTLYSADGRFTYRNADAEGRARDQGTRKVRHRRGVAPCRRSVEPDGLDEQRSGARWRRAILRRVRLSRGRAQVDVIDIGGAG